MWKNINFFNDIGPSQSALRQRSTLTASVRPQTLVDYLPAQQRGRPSVDLALRLNVLAMFAAMAFIGAIVLGAF